MSGARRTDVALQPRRRPLSGRLRGRDRVQGPRSGNAFQRVGAALNERDPGAGDQILHGAGDEHFAGGRERRDARARVR